MYCWCAMLFHLPKSFMVDSGTPAWLAMVAAPILKLCQLKSFPRSPASVRAGWIWVAKEDLVRGAPSCCIKRGPVQLPRIDNLVRLPLGRCQ